jgi:hypothetical protein
MLVDYASMTVAITNPLTDEIRQATVFVATFPASGYIYVKSNHLKSCSTDWTGMFVPSTSLMAFSKLSD